MQLQVWLSSAALCTLSICGICSNVLLLVVILKKSTGVMRKYSFLLFNFIFTDLAACFLTVFILPQYVFQDGKMLIVAWGFCTYLGEHVCFTTYSLLICLFSHLTWLLLASILFRWYILCYGGLSNKQLAIFLIIVFFPTCIQLSCTETVAFSNAGRSVMEVLKDTAPFQNQTVFGSKSRETMAIIITELLIVVPVFPIFIAGLFLRKGIKKTLETFHTVSENCKRIKKSFYRSLSVQILILPIHLLAVIVFICDKHKITVSSGQMAYVLVHHIPFLNAACQLYYVTPYRKYVYELLGVNFQESRTSHKPHDQMEMQKI